MSGQELIAFVVGAGALAYLTLRVLRRRRAGTCCGARTCPATADLLRRLERARAGSPDREADLVTGIPPRGGLAHRPR